MPVRKKEKIMSSLIVEIVQVDEIKVHPNADKLEIVIVKGWECVAQKESYKVGDKVIYAPIDSMIPPELADNMGISTYLSKGKVKTAKLRDIYSQGLLIPLKYLPNPENFKIGDDVAEVLGITKFIPPITFQMEGMQRANEARFYKYTDIENIKNFPTVLQQDEEVVITEKLHGTNFRVANIDGELHVGGHRTDFNKSDENLYWKAAKLYNLQDILNSGEQLFGEIYGFKIQKLAYGLKNKFDVRFFDLMVNSRYVNYAQFKEFCEKRSIPMVPELYIGKWNNDLMDMASGKTTLAEHVKEGIVITPLTERFDEILGRVIVKHINEKYLMKDYGEEIWE